MKISEHNLDNFSFPDFEVLFMRLDIGNKIITIKAEGCYFKSSQMWEEVGPIFLTISNWKNINIFKSSYELKTWNKLDIEEFEPIKLIQTEFLLFNVVCTACFKTSSNVLIYLQLAIFQKNIIKK